MSCKPDRSDVSAVVLSVGEPYTERARASVQRQVPPLADTILVRGVVPFHRALNTGAAQVRTPYFLQVDADMILDDTCCAALRACMSDGVGIVIGHLRDPMLGRVQGVKLFRTAGFAHTSVPDSISPDTDFSARLGAHGLHTIYALKLGDGTPELWHTFGEHRPDYTPLYTFRKHVVKGARFRYRRSRHAPRTWVRRLHASRHPLADFAIIGIARGILLPIEHDLLAPYERDDDFDCLERLLEAKAGVDEPPPGLNDLRHADARQAFERGYRYGIACRVRQAATFRSGLRHLAGDGSVTAWAALVGLSHGVLADSYDAVRVERLFTLFAEILPGEAAASE
jgi:hypothetical protein